MRRKNRQIKMTIDIPDDYENEEDFMLDFQERMDEVNWKFPLDADNEVSISAITLGDVEIAPEETE